jgi:hypothetical protein
MAATSVAVMPPINRGDATDQEQVFDTNHDDGPGHGDDTAEPAQAMLPGRPGGVADRSMKCAVGWCPPVPSAGTLQ